MFSFVKYSRVKLKYPLMRTVFQEFVLGACFSRGKIYCRKWNVGKDPGLRLDGG